MIATERLLLRRARMDDLANLHRVFAEPRAMRNWDSLPHDVIDLTRRWLSGMGAYGPVRDRHFQLLSPGGYRGTLREKE